jgi:hypothetical protein
MSPEMHEKVIQHINADPMVLNVIDAKSEEIGDGVYRFKAEIREWGCVGACASRQKWVFRGRTGGVYTGRVCFLFYGLYSRQHGAFLAAAPRPPRK